MTYSENPVALLFSQLNAQRHSFDRMSEQDLNGVRNLILLFTQSESVEEAEFYLEGIKAIGHDYDDPDLFFNHLEHMKKCSNCSKKEMSSKILSTIERLGMDL